MARAETEAQFVALWWRDARHGKDSALRIMGHIRGEMLEHLPLADAYTYLTGRFAKGLDLDDLEAKADLTRILGKQWYQTIAAESQQRGSIASYVRQVLFNWRARRQASYLQDMADQAAQLVSDEVQEEEPSKLAHEVMAKLASFHTTQGDLDQPVTQQEITDRARQRLLTRTDNAGIAMPYSKIADHTGNLLPGDVVAIAGYSNSGKSLYAANLWRFFVTQQVPVIAFPTEMGLAWHARAVAAHSRTPQLVAEREQWSLATAEQIEAYDFGLRDLGQCPWEIVPKPSITVAEIIARTSVLRRRWPGQTVVLMVDHMHRLDYGSEDADAMVGRATREIRNWIKQDTEGGIIAILLYQPRKPLDDLQLYRPVDGYRIRGKSEVWNEIDFLLSPYRRWVKADPSPVNRTPWGGPGTLYNKDGWPQFTVPNKEGSKLDDERVYIKIGKRRVGGEGPTAVLQVDAPSGHIYQIERPKLAAVGSVA